MARNEEKAQSMLYRFREAQAAELGLGTRSDRRPKMASACKSLRDCERWRGEMLREISRKVAKIQDAGLSDYELRDINDEINKLMREKRHWENQIVALGGANYRRNVAMLDDDGKEVPGTKGYKYFGRAKELPGVKELFAGRKKEEDEENLAAAYYKKFTNQGPAYFGDLDEGASYGVDGEAHVGLLEEERLGEEEEWQEAYVHAREALGISADQPIPPIPRGAASTGLASATSSDGTSKTKRKAGDEEDVEMDETDGAKRSKTLAKKAPSGTEPNPELLAHARAAAAYIPFLTAEALMPPTMPTRDEMEQVLLALRKQALVDEYFGDEGPATTAA